MFIIHLSLTGTGAVLDAIAGAGADVLGAIFSECKATEEYEHSHNYSKERLVWLQLSAHLYFSVLMICGCPIGFQLPSGAWYSI